MYVVVEIQKRDGGIITNTSAYETRNQAENVFYSILAQASISDADVHSAAILTEEGYIDKCRSYKHNEEEDEKSKKGIK